jgi:hypothetical protein
MICLSLGGFSKPSVSNEYTAYRREKSGKNNECTHRVSACVRVYVFAWLFDLFVCVQ